MKVEEKLKTQDRNQKQCFNLQIEPFIKKKNSNIRLCFEVKSEMKDGNDVIIHLVLIKKILNK